MTRLAVIGLGCGDEGKGMVTSALSRVHQNPIVIRFSGGHQAGHTVVKDGKKHIFANFGSGTLHGIPTYWSSKCTVDPVALIAEMRHLVEIMGKDVSSVKLFIDQDCPITTPYDIEFQRDSKSALDNQTCGVGFGQTLQREEDHYKLHFSDLSDPAIWEIKLGMISKYYGGIVVDEEPFHKAIEILNTVDMLPSSAIEVVDDIPEYTTEIYEGSQGLLLDQDIGFFPYVTRSNVGMRALAFRHEPIDQVYYVTRAYQTRHGAGPMTNETHPNFQLVNTKGETNVKNQYQGEFRTSVLDANLLKYALEKDRMYRGFSNNVKEKLVVTCMDQMVELKFTWKGKTRVFDNEVEFVEDLGALLGFKRENIYVSYSPESEIR